jgi:hypothetical protein
LGEEARREAEVEAVSDGSTAVEVARSTNLDVIILRTGRSR